MGFGIDSIGGPLLVAFLLWLSAAGRPRAP